MPLMPTTAWAIMLSAGQRRGSDGIAGTSYSLSAKRAASVAERWGSEPIPVDVPAGNNSSGGTPRAKARPVGRSDNRSRSSGGVMLFLPFASAHHPGRFSLSDRDGRRRIRIRVGRTVQSGAVPDRITPVVVAGSRRLLGLPAIVVWAARAAWL